MSRKDMRKRKSLARDREVVLLGEVGKAGDVRLELQRDRAGRSMALFADDHFGLAVDQLHLGLPLEMLFGADARLAIAQVILLAKHEHHDVGVLLDRARFAQVRELWALVVAVLDLAREL